MFSNFLKVTLRTFYRDKAYAIINIAGLSIAITCFLILGLYLKSELSYDLHNKRYREIFRVLYCFELNNRMGNTHATTSPMLGPMLAEEYAEIRGFVRLTPNGEQLYRYKEKAFYWMNTYMADDNIFDIFTHDIIYGDPETALKDPSSVAVSESFVKKYFGNTDPIGEIISNDQGDIYKITLVFADLPENSHMKYDALFSYNQINPAKPGNAKQQDEMLLNLMNTYTYLLMPEGYDIGNFKSISNSFVSKHIEGLLKGSGVTWHCWLQPLADTHFQSDVGRDLPNGNKLYLYGFTVVAFLILIVACINYVNLATSRAAKRAREVGLRKELGAGRMSLILQFLGESIFFSLIALICGFILVEAALTLTPINELLNNSIALKDLKEPRLWGVMLVFGISIGTISGIYPALYLSSMLPVSALVKDKRRGKTGFKLREMLILIQFTISVCVIACTLLMSLQIHYISNKSLGFNKENRVIVPVRDINLIRQLPVIKTELLKNSSILGVFFASTIMGQNPRAWAATIENNDGVWERNGVAYIAVSNDFVEVMGIKLVSGNDFTGRRMTDAGYTYIVNESFVKKMGWKEPLGKRIYFIDDNQNVNSRVIGVVKDFHFASLHNQVGPIVLRLMKNENLPGSGEGPQRGNGFIVLNISGKNIHQTISYIQNKLEEFDKKHPFTFEFLNDALNKLYLSDQHLMTLLGIFACVCIFISCIGLFGLTAFTTEQRTREIGIRKVLGASSWQIIIMLVRNVLLFVLSGAAIASILAYYAMDEWWLIDFAYRINLIKNLWVFLVSAAAAVTVAFITVAVQSYKTTMSNPVKALRHE